MYLRDNQGYYVNKSSIISEGLRNQTLSLVNLFNNGVSMLENRNDINGSIKQLTWIQVNGYSFHIKPQIRRMCQFSLEQRIIKNTWELDEKI